MSMDNVLSVIFNNPLVWVLVTLININVAAVHIANGNLPHSLFSIVIAVMSVFILFRKTEATA